jgi:hypothetical protein
MNLTYLKTILLVIFITTFSSRYWAQSEPEIMNYLSKICINDSIVKTLAVPNKEGDSLKMFYFAPIDINKYGLAVYDYDGFRVTFETASNLLFAKVPFGKITILDYTGKSCTMLVEISGTGDRQAQNLWQQGIFTFQLAKGGRWLLSDVQYSLQPYMGGYSPKKGKK